MLYITYFLQIVNIQVAFSKYIHILRYQDNII